MARRLFYPIRYRSLFWVPLLTIMELCAFSLLPALVERSSAKRNARLLPSGIVSITLKPENSRVEVLRNREIASVAEVGGTTKHLIAVAYGVEDSQVAGGPRWISSERYGIHAVVGTSLRGQGQEAPCHALDAQCQVLLELVLLQRFQLPVRELPSWRKVGLPFSAGMEPKSLRAVNWVVMRRWWSAACPLGRRPKHVSWANWEEAPTVILMESSF